MSIGTPTKAGSTTGTTQVTNGSLTTSAAIPAGALILVSVSRQNVNAVSHITSVTDSASNTYTFLDGNGDGGQNQYTELWYCKNATALGSGGTVNANGLNLLSSGPSWSFSVWYVTGMDTTAPVDVSSHGNSNASPWATPTATTTQAADLLWAVFGGNQNEPAAITNAQSIPNTGWTAADAITYGGNSGNSLRTSYQIVSATGTDKAGGTQTVGNAGAFVFAALKGASGGGTVTGSSTMGNVDGGLQDGVVVQTENTFTAGLVQGGLASVVNFPANSPLGGSGGLAAVVSQALASAFNLGMPGGGLALPTIYSGVITLSDVGGGLLAFSDALAQLSLGNLGAGLIVTPNIPVVGTAFMGTNDVGGLYPLFMNIQMGSVGDGISIPLAFTGDLNGKWVIVFVNIWRSPGQWNLIPVKMWRRPGQWDTLST